MEQRLAGPPALDESPKVWLFMRIYVVVMALLYWGFAVLFAVLFAREPSTEPIPTIVSVMRAGLLLLCVALGAAFLAMLFLPRRPWSWIYGIVLLALGSTSLCIAPATIPMLVFWVQPGVRTFWKGPGERLAKPPASNG